MTYEGLGEMFEVDFADMCTEKFPLVLMEGLGTPSSMHRWGRKRTPINASGN